MIAGHYRLVEHIGSGAMGVVWRAVDERLERSVAVKQILAQPGMSETERNNMRQRAMREAKNAARFQHPNAIVVFDIAEHSGDPCLVMEYLPSRSLSAVLAEQTTLPLAQVAKIGSQVASALVAAHRAGIVHRDIKPANILIDEAGTAKITDFGISRAAGDLTLTQTGLIGGTPAYLAPELARGSDPSPASDVFSLGATLYHALEGQPPYGNSTNQLALLYTAANGQVIPPRQSGKATALLMNLLRIEPDERPSMIEARDKLAALAAAPESASPAAPSPTLVAPPTPPPGRPAAGVAGNPMPAGQVGQGDRPPWQRVNQPVGGNAPSFAGMPPQQPRLQNPTAAYHPTSRPPVRPQQSSSPLKNKGVLIGSIAAGVVVIATVVFLILNSKGNDHNGTPQPGQGGTSTSQASRPSSGPSSPAAALGGTPSTGKVNIQDAANLVVGFLDPLTSSGGSSEGWNKLTPAAQQIYGSQDAFITYWSQHRITGYRNVSADQGANSDGSVELYTTIDGAGRPHWRVVNTGEGLKIDANTKAFGG
ncbi:serine/threonine-protein kinase [Amycolatopsis pigmentata]|uniref:non-specific serine/threonine protein kinase n=1 Tax=Amycolatopsis pigmentata TaxID=450801 RepID=A0ABW5G205_9PSEU